MQIDGDGHDKLDKVEGFFNALGSDMLLGAGRMEPSNSDYAAGQEAGDVAAIVGSAVESAVGTYGDVTGKIQLAFAPETDGASLLTGAVTIAAGDALVAHAGATATTATVALMKGNSGQSGEVYVTEPQKSGKPYVGRTTQGTDERMKTRTDGRTGKAKTVDTYKSRKEGQYKEQKHMDKRGGVDKLDNKRREVSKERMKALEKKFGKKGKN